MTHSGRALSSGVKSDLPPSGSRGESKAQIAAFLAARSDCPLFKLRSGMTLADDCGTGTVPVLEDGPEGEV